LHAPEVDAASIAKAYGEIAYILKTQGKYNEAFVILRKMIDFRLKTVHHESPVMANIYEEYADALLKVEGKEHEAVEISRKALRILLQERGFGNPLLWSSYERLGDCLRRVRGNEGEVVELYRKAALTPGYGYDSRIYTKLANSLELVGGKGDEALEMYRKALEILLKDKERRYPVRKSWNDDVKKVNNAIRRLEETPWKKPELICCKQWDKLIHNDPHAGDGFGKLDRIAEDKEIE